MSEADGDEIREPIVVSAHRIHVLVATKRIFFRFFFVTWLCWEGVATASSISGPQCTFAHGVSVHHAMNWATLEPGTRRYVSPPFNDASHALTESSLDIIKLSGFDFVRLTIDPGPYLQAKGNDLSQAYEVLRQRVALIHKAGLSVIVDIHPVSQNPDYRPQRFVEGTDTQFFHEYCEMLTKFARVLSESAPDRTAVELLNEPEIGWSGNDDQKWQITLDEAYRTVRDISPAIWIVLSGDRSSSLTGLEKLSTKAHPGDARVLYSFHYYSPMEFTHQANKDLPPLDIPYPADARPLSDGTDALNKWYKSRTGGDADRTARTAKYAAYLAKYRASGFNRQNIHEDFARVVAWADANHIPRSRILLGEFGVIRRYSYYAGARDSERVLWLRDVRQEAEALGFAWSIWAYRGYGGMAITKEDNSDKIDAPTLDALGLSKN